MNNCHVLYLQLYLSTRRGAWILNRVGVNGLPLDLQFNRVKKFLLNVLPFGVYCGLAENMLNQRFDHSLYNLKPNHRYCIYICCYMSISIKVTVKLRQGFWTVACFTSQMTEHIVMSHDCSSVFLDNIYQWNVLCTFMVPRWLILIIMATLDLC